jgi:hypothetical protein
MKYRFGIVGWRRWEDFATFTSIVDEHIARILKSMVKKPAAAITDLCIVTGCCPTGVDRMARRYAHERSIECTVHTAEWSVFRDGAGPIRNAKLVADISEMLAFEKRGTPGTKNAIKLALLAAPRVKLTRVSLDNEPVRASLKRKHI